MSFVTKVKLVQVMMLTMGMMVAVTRMPVVLVLDSIITVLAFVGRMPFFPRCFHVASVHQDNSSDSYILHSRLAVPIKSPLWCSGVGRSTCKCRGLNSASLLQGIA